MVVSTLNEPSGSGQPRLPPFSTKENHPEEVTMARPAPSGKGTTPPGKRTRIGTLDIIIVIVGVVFIIGYNRLSIAKLQRSLPNANSQIVGEWKSTRGPEHLVFRADKTVSLTVAPAPAQDNAAPAAPESGTAGAAAPEIPAPLVGKYQLTEAGKVYVQLSDGKKYTTTIAPLNKNRFDLIDTYTDGVTTYERVP